LPPVPSQRPVDCFGQRIRPDVLPGGSTADRSHRPSVGWREDFFFRQASADELLGVAFARSPLQAHVGRDGLTSGRSVWPRPAITVCADFS
jgi:hypothetical protein